METPLPPPDPDQTAAPRYNPIKLRGDGPTASEIVIRDRDRFRGSEQPGITAREASETRSEEAEAE